MTYICEDCEEELDTLQQMQQHYVHIHRKYVESHDIVDKDQPIDNDDDNNNEDDEDESEIDSAEEEEEDGYDVWGYIANNKRNDDKDFVESFKDVYRLTRSFNRNEVVKDIKQTIKNAENDDNMKFDEALHFGSKKRKFLINKTANQSIEENMNE